jgi:hypothetical protein
MEEMDIANLNYFVLTSASCQFVSLNRYDNTKRREFQ